MKKRIRLKREHCSFLAARTPEAISKLVPTGGQLDRRRKLLAEVEALFGLRPKPSVSAEMRTIYACLAVQKYSDGIWRKYLRKNYPEALQGIEYLMASGIEGEPQWGENLKQDQDWLRSQFGSGELQAALNYKDTQFKKALRDMRAQTDYRRLNEAGSHPKSRSIYGAKAAYWLLKYRLERMNARRARENARQIQINCKSWIEGEISHEYPPDVGGLFRDGPSHKWQHSLWDELRPIIEAQLARK